MTVNLSISSSSCSRERRTSTPSRSSGVMSSSRPPMSSTRAWRVPSKLSLVSRVPTPSRVKSSSMRAPLTWRSRRWTRL